MKKLFTSLLLAVTPLLLQAQSGDLDFSFNGNGVVIGNYTDENNAADAMAIQADGKILVAGATGTPSSKEVGVSRFNTDGSLDTSFANNGKLVFSTGWIKSYVLDMKVQTDGKIVMAGYRWNNATGDIVMARLNEDGSFDTSFGTNGIAIIDGGETEIVESFSLLPDGKFILAGYVNDDFTMVKANSDGSIDTTFGNNGWVMTQFGSQISNAFDINVNSEGKIVLGGSVLGSDNVWMFALAKYNSDGSLDTSFNGNGQLEFSVGSSHDFGIKVIQLDNGKILVGGHSWYQTGPSYELAVALLNADGSFDASYGDNGIFKTSWIENGENYLSDMVLQPDGKLVITGRAIYSGVYEFGLVRLNENGTLDDGFGQNGKIITSIDVNDSKSINVALQSDGKIVVSGDTNPPSDNIQFFIARYLNDSMGVQDVDNSDIKLYPNPATNQINIEWTQSIKEQQVEIFTILGQKVLTSKIGNKGSIDVSSLAVGSYFVRLTNNGKATTLRFIKK